MHCNEAFNLYVMGPHSHLAGSVHRRLSEKPIGLISGIDAVSFFQIVPISGHKPSVLEGFKGNTFVINDLNIETLR
jgi:hypothetical protein